MTRPQVLSLSPSKVDTAPSLDLDLDSEIEDSKTIFRVSIACLQLRGRPYRGYQGDVKRHKSV